jgi:hypothetical protein
MQRHHAMRQIFTRHRLLSLDITGIPHWKLNEVGQSCRPCILCAGVAQTASFPLVFLALNHNDGRIKLEHEKQIDKAIANPQTALVSKQFILVALAQLLNMSVPSLLLKVEASDCANCTADCAEPAALLSPITMQSR